MAEKTPQPDSTEPEARSQGLWQWLSEPAGLFSRIVTSKPMRRLGGVAACVFALVGCSNEAYAYFSDKPMAGRTLEVTSRGEYGAILLGTLVEGETIFAENNAITTGIASVAISGQKDKMVAQFGQLIGVDTTGLQELLKGHVWGYYNPEYTLPGSTEKQRATAFTNIMTFKSAALEKTIFAEAPTAKMRAENKVPAYLRNVTQKVITVRVDGENLVKVRTLVDTSLNPYLTNVTGDGNAILQKILDAPLELQVLQELGLAPGATISRAVDTVAVSAGKGAAQKQNIGCFQVLTTPDATGKIPAAFIDPRTKEPHSMTLEEAAILSIKQQSVDEYKKNTGIQLSLDDVEVLVNGKVTVDIEQAIKQSTPDDAETKKYKEALSKLGITIKIEDYTKIPTTECKAPVITAATISEAQAKLNESTRAIPATGRETVKAGG